ncbi:MAG: type II toxin-antitoxin system Phd/YefM family antitoxin [Candidatus Hydrogenedentes bacterium]|nr:type II toxin-antitoxin system Phd/YefM family antitoxin [Candidatus Hydrogenedentota bacterium]
MKTVTFTEFRSHASGLITEVENGETVVIVRHGRPIAEILPYAERVDEPSWKRPALRLTSKGQGLADAILKERRNAKLL